MTDKAENRVLWDTTMSDLQNLREYAEEAEAVADQADWFRAEERRLREAAETELFAARELIAMLEGQQARADALSARLAEVEAALAWAYSGDGLDEVALQAQSILRPFSKETKPDHMVQVALRVVIDAIRARAALSTDAKEGRG